MYRPFAQQNSIGAPCKTLAAGIEGISDFNIKIESSTLYVSFTAETLYGNIDINNLALPGKQGVS